MLSIVIPTYNREGPLKKCIDSILPQYQEDLEVILIDDCSTDGTAAWLKELGSQYRWIKIHINTVNKGVNYSRNRGIEKATQPYILFLDSDDELAPGSLENVEMTIGANPSFTHLLFVVSDRKTEFETMLNSRSVTYEDWLSSRISGDFTHVVDSKIMKQYPFFEQFRTFEHLNWLRVKKTTAPQLLSPLIVANRERGRSDCLTDTMRLRNGHVIRSKFEAEKIYYSLYHDDLRKYNPSSLSNQLLQAITLGIACDKKSDSRRLVRYADSVIVKVMANFLLLFPSPVVKRLVIQYSALRNR